MEIPPVCVPPWTWEPVTLDHHGVPPPENRRRGEAGRGTAQDCWPPKPDLAINSTRGERYTERQVEKFFFLILVLLWCYAFVWNEKCGVPNHSWGLERNKWFLPVLYVTKVQNLESNIIVSNYVFWRNTLQRFRSKPYEMSVLGRLT